MKDRIKEILDSKGLNATQFAQRVGMNVSALSHILSGRNNPGYDALQKIINSFPSLSIEWLMTGQGEMCKEMQDPRSEEFTLFDESRSQASISPVQPEYPRQKASISPQKSIKYTDTQSHISIQKTDTKIRKIAVFYSDNTYEEFYPQ